MNTIAHHVPDTIPSPEPESPAYFRLEVQALRWGGCESREGWRPAVAGELNQTRDDDETASLFDSLPAAQGFADRFVVPASPERWRIVRSDGVVVVRCDLRAQRGRYAVEPPPLLAVEVCAPAPAPVPRRSGGSAFSPGDVVVSSVNAQGLVRGQRYKVVDLKTRRTFAGGFTTYLVRALDRTIARVDDQGHDVLIPVGNGHLVLQLAPDGEARR